jgi:CRISPR-associated endonuclease/helicase Cas3
MRALSAEDFPHFFREVNGGADPFPWQARLASEVLRNGRWPKSLDLPTGSGKTAVLDIAIFHLALEARRESGRLAPARIAFVVDRRLIVDQAYERAAGILRSLDPEREGPAGEVARELIALAGEGSPPLVVRALRGGMPRESDWARTPAQPTVLISTVDQVGSRLLFRGYGISASMRPVHAGLLGSDCLIFLDEAHLSEPFRQTLDWVGHYRQARERGAPWAVVAMSATLPEAAEQPFRMDPEQDLSDPRLRRRLAARKPAELREVSADPPATAYAEAARELASRPGIDRVLVAVNRVDLARSIFERFHPEERAFLLTGRIRELDRKRVVSKLLAAMAEPGGKLYAVATQCVEAGADFDFDGLVSQIAPLDALRQRFGRLNRTGREIEAQALILASKQDLASKKADPIYGTAAKEAWKLLNRVAERQGRRSIVDFGSLAFANILASREIRAACSEKPDAPVMPPAYVDLWTCTSPSPAIEADLGLFLHGPGRASADVEVVWRGDILESDMDRPAWLADLVSIVPPRAGETLPVPIWSVRQWLDARPGADRIGDIEGEREPEEDGGGEGKRVLRWFGPEDERTGVIRAEEIRPGDVIVVPAAYGGCDEWGWTGRRMGVVHDLAAEAARRLRTREAAIRLHPELLQDVRAASEGKWMPIRRALEAYPDDGRSVLEELRRQDLITADEVEELESAEVALFYEEDDPGGGAVLVGRRVRASAPRELTEPSSESDAAGSLGSFDLTLVRHTQQVVARAQDFARRSGVSDRVFRAIVFAAQFHDMGKADRRFQRYLRAGGSGEEILAKSGRRFSVFAERQARADAMLPDNWRHEALSVRIALADPGFMDGDMDRELALWLIGTHHGRGRPFFPHDDPLDDVERTIRGDHKAWRLPAAPGPQRLDFDWNGWDWAGLFGRLQERYGPWELARLEAILRLADHRASEDADAERAHTAGSGA